MNKVSVGLCAVCALATSNLQAHGLMPGAQSQVNFFVHADTIQRDGEATKREEFTLGEAALFAATRLSDRWSALTEITYQPALYRADTVKVERLQLRYEMSEEQYFVVGKVHTPMNFWNDTYHHGRFFFPTISRPLAFERFIPIHDIGLRWGGREIGDQKFFFDVVAGSGISAEFEHEFFGNGVNAGTVSAGFYPTDDWLLQIGYYRDKLIDHESLPGHQAHMQMGDMERVDLDYDLWAMSSHFENSTCKLLTEISINRTEDSDWNYSVFQYAGYKFSPDLTAYAYYDVTSVEDGGIHFVAGEESRMGVGLSYFFDASAVFKLELIDHEEDLGLSPADGIELRAQVAVGF
jgi:hypothetical protein